MRYDTQRFLFVPSILLFIHFSSLSSSLSLWQLTSSFAYHGHSSSSSPPFLFPFPDFDFIFQEREPQKQHLSSTSPSSSQRCPPSAFLSRAQQRLYGPLSYQLHCGISRLSGLSSGELSVPPPLSVDCWEDNLCRPCFFFFLPFFFCLNRIKMKERMNAMQRVKGKENGEKVKKNCPLRERVMRLVQS